MPSEMKIRVVEAQLLVDARAKQIDPYGAGGHDCAVPASSIRAHSRWD
jgi:hypothetical protein